MQDQRIQTGRLPAPITHSNGRQPFALAHILENHRPMTRDQFAQFRPVLSHYRAALEGKTSAQIYDDVVRLSQYGPAGRQALLHLADQSDYRHPVAVQAAAHTLEIFFPSKTIRLRTSYLRAARRMARELSIALEQSERPYELFAHALEGQRASVRPEHYAMALLPGQLSHSGEVDLFLQVASSIALAHRREGIARPPKSEIEDLYFAFDLAICIDRVLSDFKSGRLPLSQEQQIQLHVLKAMQFTGRYVSEKNPDLSGLGLTYYDYGGGCHAPGEKIQSGPHHPDLVYSVLVALPKFGHEGRQALAALATDAPLGFDYALLARHALHSMTRE